MPRQVLLRDKGVAPARGDLLHARREFSCVLYEEHVLAGHPLPRLDHQRKGRVGRYLEGVRGEDRVDGREMPPQERLVLRAGRGAPVLGGQPEVRGGQGGGRLEEVAVGEDGRGLPVDAGDDVPEVGDVALDDRSVERMGAGTVGEKRHIEAGRAAAGRNPCVTESVALPATR